MKTSKKLLSFFLAVVMVVTTCSVGFTAFAKTNDSIWTTQCEADDAFDALDALAGELLPSLLTKISAIGEPLKDKENPTLQDVLGVLQPMLLELLAKKSQGDFASDRGIADSSVLDYLNTDNKCTKCGKYWNDNELIEANGAKWCPNGCYITDTDENGNVKYDEDGNESRSSTIKTATMSYYTILNLCSKYKNDSGLTSDQRKQLSDWYDALAPLAALATASDDVINIYIQKFNSTDENYTNNDAPLVVLEAFDFGVTEADATAIEAMCGTYNTILKEVYNLDEKIKIDSLADIIYYFFGAGKNILSIYAAYDLILLSRPDGKLPYSGTTALLSSFPDSEMPYDLEDITPDNYYEQILAPFNAVAQSTFGIDTFAEAILTEEIWIADSLEEVEGRLLNEISEGYLNTILLGTYYNNVLMGIAVQRGAVSSVEEFQQKLSEQLINGAMGATIADFTDDEIKSLAIAVELTRLNGKEAEYADRYFSGEPATYESYGLEFTITLPAALKGTAIADYFRLIVGYSKNTTYKNNFITALLPNWADGTCYERNANNTLIAGEDGLPIIKPGNDPDVDTVNAYIAAGEQYAYSKVFTELTGINGTIKDDSTIKDEESKQPFVIDVSKYLVGDLSSYSSVTLSEEQIAILNDNYDFTGDIGTYIVNKQLNNTIGNIVPTIENLVGGLMLTDITLKGSLDNLWARLVESPVATVIELVPVIMVFLDELIVPILFNQDDDQYHNLLINNFGNQVILADLGMPIDTREWMLVNGSYIGISQLDWDLNKLLPELMHWLLGDKEYNYTFYGTKDSEGNKVDSVVPVLDTTLLGQFGEIPKDTDVKKYVTASNLNTADPKHYTVIDTEGNELKRVDDGDNTTFTYRGKTDANMDVVLADYPDAVFNLYMTYECNVPVLTGIYIADKALAGAEIADLHKIFAKLFKGNESVALGLEEVVAELATVFTAALEKFVATPELTDIPRYDNNGNKTGNGLNNIFVAIPQLFDLMEDIAADKYGVDKSLWTYCYDGKINSDNKYNTLTNQDLENFKGYAASTDKEKSKDILDCFVGIFVEQWLDAILSLANNLVDSSTLVGDGLPIITGLIRSLGGFGESSIFTDIFNSVFQQKRGDRYSFEFKPQDTTGLTGLSRDNAYFLITNIPTIVDVIKKLADSFSSGEPETASFSASLSSIAAEAFASSANGSEIKTFSPSTYTTDELKDVNGVVESLDDMLSSLLSDSSIDGYKLNTTGNIASGVVSLLSNYISEEDATSLLGLVDSYLFYLDGAGERTADENGNMKPEEVYTNKNLTDLVVRTFALIESIAESLLSNFDYNKSVDEQTTITYNLLVRAIEGVISPDAIALRLAGYDDAQSKIAQLTVWNDALAEDGSINVSIDWNVDNGDNEAFFGGLSSALRLLTTIFGVLLVDTGWYETIVYPVLSAICEKNGVEVDTPAEFAALTNGYHDEVLLGLLRPVTALLDKLIEAPVETLVYTLQGVAKLLDDTTAPTLASVVKGALTPIQNELEGVCTILTAGSDKLGPISPTFATAVDELAAKIGKYAETSAEKPAELINITSRGINLSGSNLILIVNKLIAATGIVLNNIDWNSLSNLATPAEFLAFIVEYLVDTIKSNDNIDVLADLIVGNDEPSSAIIAIVDAIKSDKLTGKAVFGVLSKVLHITQDPTLFAWTFEMYLQKIAADFSYPLGLSKAQADTAAQSIDEVINNVFPLLQTLGVNLGGADLNSILSNNLFKNELLTQLAVTLFGALDGNSTIKTVMGVIGVPTSTADVAAILMDTSFGATYSEAAAAIGAKASWNELKTVTKDANGKETTTYASINWGFTNGAANAQQGFVNALAAILRPLNNILGVFLNSGSLGFNISDTINTLITKGETKTAYLAIGESFARLTITSTGSQLSIKILNVTADNDSAPAVSGAIESEIILDLKALDNIAIYGTNAYNSAIIPLLEALGCTGIVNEAQYKKDVAAAKDNLLLDILNPIAGGESTSLINKIVASPVVEICKLLPNVAMYLDAHGLSQLVANIIAPITNVLYAANDAIDLGAIIVGLLDQPAGTSLGDAVAKLLGLEAGTLTIDLSDLTTLNIEQILIPLVNKVLFTALIPKALTDEKKAKMTAQEIADYEAQRTLLQQELPKFALSNIKFEELYKLGTKAEYTSLATDANGNALTGKIVKDVDYGKVLITVLRYVLNNVKSNIAPLSTILTQIKAIKTNETLLGIVSNVLNQIKTHTSDQIIVAIYYFFVGDNTQDYWDYTNYKTKASTYTYPDGVKAEDVAALIGFIDGIVDELDLEALINQYLYTDSIINALAKAIYVSLGDVKLGSNLKLGTLLTSLGIGIDTKSVAALLSDKSYGETAQYKDAVAVISAAKDWSAVDFGTLKWGVTDQTTFLNALVAVLRPLAGLLDTVLADGKLNLLGGINIPGSNDYESTIVPLLEAIGCENIKSYDKYLADKTKAKDALLLDILEPLFGFVNKVVESPIDTIATAIPNIALFIGNDGIVQLIKNLITPITAIIRDINPIIDVDALLVQLLKGKQADAAKLGIDLSKLSITNVSAFAKTIVGGDTLIPFVNKLLSSTGFEIPAIDWLALAGIGTIENASSAVKCIGKRMVVKADTAKVLTAVLEYVLNAVLKNGDAIKKLIGNSYKGTLKDILDIVFALDARDLLSLVFNLVGITQSPTEVFWSYKNYKAVNAQFKYPDGITAEDADEAVALLDNAVGGVIALLGGLDVVDADDLSGLVSGLLFKNEMITKLAKTLYGALDNDKIGPYLKMAGIPVKTKDVAELLTDTSYGKTYSSAAKTIAAAKNWSKVDKVNWGFTDGAANAEQGFVNALVAVLRPVLNILGPFLNGENLELGNILYNIIVGLDINSGDKSKGETLVSFKNGLLKVETQKNGVYTTAIELNLANLKTLKELNLYGANGYENSIIPLLDVLQVDNSEIKSFDQYVKDCNKAKDNILLDILNPLMSFIDRVLEAPFDTITSVLPNLAYFIDNNGVGQLLDNILSPVTQFIKEAKKDGVDVDAIIKTIAGKDLGKLVTDLLKLKGVKLNLKLTNLSACNIQEIVVPLINSLLKKTGIQLPEFKWSTIASHGEVVTSKSKAENREGKFTNKEVIADKGETLVAVLRYVAQTLINNSKAIKDLLCGIDAIKKNDMISSIIKSVFNTIGASSADSIVRAVFYFIKAEPRNAFWDYTAYETGEYDFSYPETVDQDFLVNLPPMLDGLIGGLLESKGGLNGLIGGLIFKDEIISSLATGLYGAIEGVKINDNTNLAQLLALTNIDFTASHVAQLLVNEKYGKTYESAASVIAKAGSWAKVNKDSLKWGVTDRDSFFHALAAVLRPIYGVLDVLLNDASLGIFDIVRIPGSNGYTSSIVPLMEAFSMYNIKTQYQYREDINEEYDAILLDIINPLWDKIEDILNAPLQTIAAMLPNLALFIGNDGLCQIINNLLTPVSALIDAIKPVVNLNDVLTAVLGALKVDLGSILAKIGITNFNLDLYDLMTTLMPILGGDSIIPLVNNIIGLIKIKGTPLGLKLNDVDWLKLASHGETIVSASQAATYGSRIFVVGDSSETLIAVLSYLIETVNAGDNFDKISSLVGGLLGDNVSDSISGVIDQVLGALQGDTDKVIGELVGILQILA